MRKFVNFPVWLKLTSLLTVFFTVVGLAMTLYSSQSQKKIAMEQARRFADSIEHITLAGLTSMMMTNTIQHREVFLGQINRSANVTYLNILRGKPVDAQYGKGKGNEMKPNKAEKMVLSTGKPIDRIITTKKQRELQIINPILAQKMYLNRPCLGCHQVKEGTILGAFSVRISLSEVDAAARKFTIGLYIIGFILFLVIIGVTFYIASYYIDKPLKSLVSDVNKVEEGNLSLEINKLADDEIGALIVAINKMINSLRNSVKNTKDNSIRLKSLSETVQNISEHMKKEAGSLSNMVSDKLTLLNNINDRLVKNADIANESGAKADLLAKQATKTTEAVEKTIKSMTEIVRKIDIVQEIAEQTNLLSLNASIESARAGQYGKGFSVVANEVGKLAETSGKASKEIAEMAKEGIEIAENASKLLSELDPRILETKKSIEEVSVSTREQLPEVNVIREFVGELKKECDTSVERSELLANSANELTSQSMLLLGLVKKFHLND